MRITPDDEGPYGRSPAYRPNTQNASGPPFRSSSTGFESSFPMGMNANKNSSNMNPSLTPNAGSQTTMPFISHSLNPTGPGLTTSTPANNPVPSSGGFPPGMNFNPTNQPPPSNPAMFSGGFPSGMGFRPPAPTSTSNPPFSPGGFPPGMNFNPSTPAPTANPMLAGGGFPPGMNPNQSAAPAMPNPSSTIPGFPPGMNANQSTAPAMSNPSSTIPGFPPVMNLNPSTPAPTTNPILSTGSFPPGMNPNQHPNQPTAPITPNPSSTTSGFPPGMNLNPTTPTATPKPPSSAGGFPPGMNTQQTPSTKAPSPNDTSTSVNNPLKPIIKQGSSIPHSLSDDDDNASRLELDFPIENVLIDANIPSAMAIKINEAVEKDRLGHAYHVNRYTYEPPVQKISVGNDQPITRRLVTSTPQRGTRYITEIRNDDPKLLIDETKHRRKPHKSHRKHDQYSDETLNQYLDNVLSPRGNKVIEAQNFQNLHDILNRYVGENPIPAAELPTNSALFDRNIINEPVFYYTARALPYDPMRNY